MKFFIYCRKSQEAEDRQVLSLDSQESEVAQLVAQAPDIEIIGTFIEAYSAKAPGRVEFNKMLDAIERGEAEGILAWHPDRLARNSMDGGRIIYMLDQGKLKDLRFCTYSFENTSQGKFMLGISFGYSKYYVDSLSENVKRGLRAKIRNGWRPGRAPLGYRNCKETRTVLPHEPHFSTVRHMFDMVLSGTYTVEQIYRCARDEWAYVTPVRKTLGGTALSRSQVHRLLRNPHYAGYIHWNGKLHPGAHKPIITQSEFRRVQQILGDLPDTRSKSRDFAFRGIFTCGSCGKGVTTELKRKPSGRTYIYYHCTRMHTSPKCTQPSIEEKALRTQIDSFLSGLHLPTDVTDWVLETLSNLPDDAEVRRQAKLTRCDTAIARLERQLENLTDLRLRDLIEDAEFKSKRQSLQLDLDAARQNAEEARSARSKFEPVEILTKFSNRAISVFANANAAKRRRILKLLGSNPVIQDKKAILLATKPFEDLRLIRDFRIMCGECDKVRTREGPEMQELITKLVEAASIIPEDELSEMNSFLTASSPQKQCLTPSIPHRG